MHVVMLRFLGELTSQISVDIDDKTSILTTSGGDLAREVARHRNIDELGWVDTSEDQSRQSMGSS
jgi:hypothetical protein